MLPKLLSKRKSGNELSCRGKATSVPYFATWFLTLLMFITSQDLWWNYFMWMEVKRGSHHAMLFSLLPSPYLHSYTYYSFPSTESKSTFVQKLIQGDALEDHQPSLSANSQWVVREGEQAYSCSNNEFFRDSFRKQARTLWAISM